MSIQSLLLHSNTCPWQQQDMSLARPYTQGEVPSRTSTELPVLILKPQTQVLELSHEVLQFLAKGCCYGCARSLTGRASLTSL